MRGFERAHSSRAGDEGTTTVECDDWADGPQADEYGLADHGLTTTEDGLQVDGPQADGPKEELSPGNRVWADRAMQLQMKEDLADPPTDRGKSQANDPLYFLFGI